MKIKITKIADEDDANISGSNFLPDLLPESLEPESESLL